MTQAGNKIALVTGAGTGVGRAASLALMNAGFTVVLAGRRVDKLEETKKLGEKVGKSLPVSADMTDPRATAALLANVTDAYGRLDVLVNNAGLGQPRAGRGSGGWTATRWATRSPMWPACRSTPMCCS